MCCERAINVLSSCGMKATSCALTIMEWYRKFRDKRGFKVNISKKDLPEICSTIKQYTREHLPELSIEFLFDYVPHTTLPRLVSDTVGRSKDEMGEDQYKLELTRTLPAIKGNNADNLLLDESTWIPVQDAKKRILR
jgi:hypothetical protein